MQTGQQRVIIENVKPSVDAGAFPVKRVINDILKVSADIFCDSHDVISAELKYKYNEDESWSHVALKHKLNDAWVGEFKLYKTGTCHYSITAWVDLFRSWHRDILKKIDASVDYAIDLLVGADIIAKVMEANPEILEPDKLYLEQVLLSLRDKSIPTAQKVEPLVSGRLFEVLSKYPFRYFPTEFEKELEVQVERPRANFSTWYEFFPRSTGPDANTHGTFKDCENFLPYVAEMGFDVVYLPPIHPIGKTNRKGKNNSVTAQPDEPGSPWAIGADGKGHKAIHPELGSMNDLKSLMVKADSLGIELALDVAFQCSPDHPYVKEHPEWFKIRPDGSLQYAENPPKKYQDIYPINFESDDWKALWEELLSVFMYWIDAGIKIFRVDNPHTKSLRFWEWVIAEIRKKHQDVIFLAEAFTRPKVMNNLAKRGFTQSYTYFTWRNTKYEIRKYCEELVEGEAREYFRPNFWPNTPDILPEFLQVTNRSGFIQRFLLAATLSSNYGIYGPAFELMENQPIAPGKEEYLNSEKFEIKDWDINKPDSLKKIIKRINIIRKENKALQNTHSLKFHELENEALVCFSKKTDNLDNIILVVVNLDPHHTHSGWIKIPLHEFDMDVNVPYQVSDLLSGAYFLWSGEHNYVEINPGVMPGHIFKIRRKVRSENDFDYFM